MTLPGHQAVSAEPVPPTQLQTSGIDHVGINVPDAEAAIAFYRELLGATVVSDIRPAEAGAEWKRRFRWHASARLARLVMIAIPGGAKIELFEYDTPEGSHDHPHQDDAGATHIALKAQDIDRSIAVLKARGLTILNDPIALPDGSRWFYFLTPWGSQMELVFPPASQIPATTTIQRKGR
ncbi:VOC family protein [Novosphingobium sp.]|uniref:VOC family protein n=1 Tax=Novosphingobium sp. TaxID=1874826 RepID=UPI0031D9F5F4